MARPSSVLLPAGGGAGHEGAAHGRHVGLWGRGGAAAAVCPLSDALCLLPLLQEPPVGEQTQGEAPHHPPARSLGQTHAAAPALHVQRRDLHQSGGPRAPHRDSQVSPDQRSGHGTTQCQHLVTTGLFQEENLQSNVPVWREFTTEQLNAAK